MDIEKFIENYEFDAKDIAQGKPYMKVISSDRVRKIFETFTKAHVSNKRFFCDMESKKEERCETQCLLCTEIE